MKKCSITVNDYTFSFPVSKSMAPQVLKTKVYRTISTIINQFNIDSNNLNCSYKVEDE